MKNQYQQGLITQGEKYNKVVDAWSQCTDRVADAMMAEISKEEVDENGRSLPTNSIFMMADSGARGSASANETACWYAWFDGETFW